MVQLQQIMFIVLKLVILYIFLYISLGVQILKNNGSVVDAAIASGICLGIVNMHSSGIGGGGVMVTFTPNVSYSKNYTIDVYDFREVAPRKIKDYLKNMTHNEMKIGIYKF